MKSQVEIKLAPTPEIDQCVKENKHIKFLEEDHWSLNGKFTYTHPIVCLSRKLERERNALKAEAYKYIELWDRATKELESLKSNAQQND